VVRVISALSRLLWHRGAAKTATKKDVVAALYDAHSRYIYRCVRALGLDEAAAEDAVQEVFAIACEKLDGFEVRENASIRTWLYAIALRIVRRSHRSRWREGPSAVEDLASTLDREASTADGPARSAELRRFLDAFRVALDALEPAQREVFVLAALEQCSAPEIASITGAPINTVYSRLRLARAKIRGSMPPTADDD
jgi:RNA polymerase sigma-70 factor, ECF subfamily